MKVKDLFIYAALSFVVIVFVSLPVIAAVLVPWFAGVPLRFSVGISILLSIVVFSVLFISVEIIDRTALLCIRNKNAKEIASCVISISLLTGGFYAIVDNAYYDFAMSVIVHVIYFLAGPLFNASKKQ